MSSARRMMLDCTLRDGGYVNDWSFDSQAARCILQALVDANIDVIECGFLSEQKGRADSTSFPTVESLNQLLANLEWRVRGTCVSMYVAMINLGEFNLSELPQCEGSAFTLQGIRLAFHKRAWRDALVAAQEIAEKGYRVFVQPMVTVSYSDREILELIDAFNALDIYAIYVVDSFGSMTGAQFRRYMALFDHNVRADIVVGYHSHNNMQLAYSNAIEFLGGAHKRDIIADSSILGMGRGAGNLNTELLADYLNANFDGNYAIDPLLEVIDSYLEGIYRITPWGYSAAHFLSASMNCHPNYASYLLHKKTLSVVEIKALLDAVSPEKRVFYDELLIEKIYKDYRAEQSEEEHFDYGLFSEKSILMLASGASVREHVACILEAGKAEKSLLVALNHIPDFVVPDFVFVSNQKRYNKFCDRLSADQLIVTSNLDVMKQHRDCKVVDYRRVLNESPGRSDNVAAIFLALLRRCAVRQVLIAGLDGYDVASVDNYSYTEYAGLSNPNMMQKRNEELALCIRESCKTLKLQFLTPSRFQNEMPLRVCGVIPARFQSSRFEGKPLVEIAGIPMLKRTYNQARKCTALNDIYVATDDERILAFCETEKIPCLMTSEDCLTGTDRVAEVMRQTDYDFYINIQGDEPIIDPVSIQQVLDVYRAHGDNYVAYNLYKRVGPEEDPKSPTMIKVIVNECDELMYMSRYAVPFVKGSNQTGCFKQVCVYGFTRGALNLFSETGKSRVEASEDIEILRFLEKGHKVKMVETECDSLSVDVPDDIHRVEAWLAKRDN
jgi:3-deoxy-D-manno-octulosonate cytidylyltransferase